MTYSLTCTVKVSDSTQKVNRVRSALHCHICFVSANRRRLAAGEKFLVAMNYNFFPFVSLAMVAESLSMSTVAKVEVNFPASSSCSSVSALSWHDGKLSILRSQFSLITFAMRSRTLTIKFTDCLGTGATSTLSVPRNSFFFAELLLLF